MITVFKCCGCGRVIVDMKKEDVLNDYVVFCKQCGAPFVFEEGLDIFLEKLSEKRQKNWSNNS